MDQLPVHIRSGSDVEWRMDRMHVAMVLVVADFGESLVMAKASWRACMREGLGQRCSQ